MTDLAAAAWASSVTNAALRAKVGHGAYFRGVDVQRDHKVGQLVAGPHGQLLSTVGGSNGERYQCVVTPVPGSGWTGQCSCPVRVDCKHCIATVIEARERLAGQEVAPAPITPQWERALSPLLEGTGNTDATLPRLALELALVGGQRVHGGEQPGRRVRLTPLKEGKRGKWIRSGASWGELDRLRTRAELRPDHLALAHDILGLYRASRNAYAYGAIDILLDDLGAGAWPLLDRASRIGLELLAAEPGVEVELRSAPASLVLDVGTPDPSASGADAGDLTVRAMVTEAGEPIVGAASVLGQPGHGVVVEQDGRWRLQPLDRAPHDVLTGLVNARRTLTVPAADAERFLGLFYPGLRRVVPVVSRSGAVELPEVVPPLLRLRVTHREGHETDIEWGFRYPSAVGGGAVDVPLAGGGGVPRDHEAERDLVAPLLDDDLVGELPGIRVFGPSGWALAPRVTLRGLDVARLASDLVPHLIDLGVVVDTSGDAAEYREATDAPVITVGVTDGPDRDWFDLSVRVHVGDEEVPLADLLRALAAGDGELLMDSGTYFSLDRPELEELRRLVEEARDLVDPDHEGLRLSVFQADLWAQLVELGVVAEQSSRWETSVTALLDSTDADPPEPPAGLRATLRPYQVEGYHWLTMLWRAGLGGVLADDMGLGKTMQTLAAVLHAKEADTLTEPVLVVAPTSVVSTWAAEAERFAPDLQVAAVSETSRRRGSSLADVIDGADVVVTSYALVRIDADEYHSRTWRTVVLDEAQFVKNHRSKTYSAIRRLPATSVFAITGTPLENSLMDLWSILSLTAPGLFASPDAFTQRYRRPIENDEPGDHLARLRRRIRPFVLRRTKELVARDLPPKQEQILRVPLAPAHRTIYDRHLQRERQRLLGLLDDLGKNRVAILAALTTLRQMALDPALVDPKYVGAAESAKLDLLVEQLTELAAEGHRVLVFSQFTRYLTAARDRLRDEGIACVYLDGRTRDRAGRIEEFRTGDATAFLISLKAGGFGLTLTEADYVYVLDPWWNPAAEEQAIDRAHRIGQTKPVNVYRLVSADTIEEKVRELQQRKQSLFDAVVDDEGALASALDAGDIRALLGE